MMEESHTDVQALLQDIRSNYGEQHEEPRRSYSRLLSNASQTPASPHFQNSIYAPQASRLQDNYTYNVPKVYTNGGLDTHDRVLLEEPEPHARYHAGIDFDALESRRISLPGHTAPAPVSPADPFKQRLHLRKPNVVLSPQDFKSQIAQHIHTPPGLTAASSSPLNAIHSSPTFVINQRRGRQQRRNQSLNNTELSSSKTLASHSSQKVVQQQIFNSFCPPGLLQQGSGQKQTIKHLQTSNPDIPQKDSFVSSPPHQPQVEPRIQDQHKLNHAPPTVQGVQLVSVNQLPDRLRSVFHYPLFNAIQSKCFATVYQSDDNMVVSAPTGGGKTAILELAICRLLSGFKNDQCKIVYMAPTKSLCSERQRDWQAKFAALDLQCGELTGDTDHSQLRTVQSSGIVVTTPEKWDSMTRKWKDHAKLMQMVKLFLIDEVHILKDRRGATLEAVVSRMKSVGTNVRFVALSATVPNSEDIATWLGHDPTNQHLPASQETFGEEFRPVKLQKYVVGLPFRGNDFGFEGICNPQLPSIIAKYSHRKPIMVFCITRKSAMDTAKLLANVWSSQTAQDRCWKGPSQGIIVQDPELKNLLTSGVAYHHAGLDGPDRHAVETGFFEGQVNVICCTSTLAVGVNLPCHMVIIKNTVSYQDDGIKEYADLEIMQMLGRAGRPQFDTTAVAVIITKQDKVKKYEKLVSGEEILESCLHLNLIDHLNAEIGLGTIYDLYTAKRWLCGTFLYVRLGQNPDHYKLDGAAVGQTLEDSIERICRRDLALLDATQLVSPSNEKLKATEFGDAMARYCIKFETMQVLMQLEPCAKLSDILSAIVQAEEFSNVRLRANERKLYKEINHANGIKFPIKVDLAIHAHKRSLIIQAELGGVEFPTDEQYGKHKRQFTQDKALMFDSIHRLIRCVIDCQIHLRDAVAVRHALELATSFGARVWDNSPYQMKQVPQIGLVAIRKLAIGGINSIEALGAAEAHRIEMLLSKNPPFGNKLLASLQDFPQLRVSIKMMSQESKPGRPVTITIKAECGFMNDKIPTSFHRRPIYICLLTERSDGFLVDFRRMSANKINKAPDILLSAELVNRTQYLTCYVMCDGVAGTTRHAELKPDLPAYLFPSPPKEIQQQQPACTQGKQSLNTGKTEQQQRDHLVHTSPVTLQDDEFNDNLEDQDMMDAVEGIEFEDIDTLELGSQKTDKTPGSKKQEQTEQPPWNPEKLDNGKWACNHKCKVKAACKHMCCREGVDKAPKPPKNSFVPGASRMDSSTLSTKSGLSKVLPTTRPSLYSEVSRNNRCIETIDLAGSPDAGECAKNAPREFKKLNQLHEKVAKGSSTPVIIRKKPTFEFKGKEQSKPSFLKNHTPVDTSSDKPSSDYWIDGVPSPSAPLSKRDNTKESSLLEKSTDYDSDWMDGLPSPSALLRQANAATEDVLAADLLEDFGLSQFNDDQADIGDALVGSSDSVAMREVSHADTNTCSAVLYSNVAHLSEPPKNYAERSVKVHSSEKLFLSTDSPEKQSEPLQKRKADVLQAEGVSLLAPVPKRSRISTEPDQTLRPSSKAETKAPPPVPMIKRGQPAWVYDFDPAFIADWQDIVEFI